MSITHHDTVTCGCGAPVEVFVADSLNAGRHPHLRQLVIDRKLHTFECGACGRPFTVEKQLLYFDFDRRQFLGVFPTTERARERECGRELLTAYETAMRDQAPELVRDLSHQFLVRIVFGYEELREKLIADELGLSDLVLEALKLDLIGSDGWFLDHRVLTVRLDSATPDGRLMFYPEWLGAPPDGVTREPFLIERAAYDALFVHHDRLVAERRDLASGPHCSLLRLIDWSARGA
jgi:CpXC protein